MSDSKCGDRAGGYAHGELPQTFPDLPFRPIALLLSLSGHRRTKPNRDEGAPDQRGPASESGKGVGRRGGEEEPSGKGLGRDGGSDASLD